MGLEDILNSFTKEQETPSEEITEPTDYGNGVLYFPCIREQFAKSLSAWIAKHPQSVVCAMSPNMDGGGAGMGSKAYGFIVVVRRVK